MKRTLPGIKMVIKILISSYVLSIRMYISKVNKYFIAMVEEPIDSYFLTMDFASITINTIRYLLGYGSILIGKPKEKKMSRKSYKLRKRARPMINLKTKIQIMKRREIIEFQK